MTRGCDRNEEVDERVSNRADAVVHAPPARKVGASSDKPASAWPSKSATEATLLAVHVQSTVWPTPRTMK
jgi:hypothetical protein